MTTTELALRNEASGGRIRLQLINVHRPSAIGHTTDELGDICRRIEAISRGRRFLLCIFGDFNHVLCDNARGRDDSATSIGTALHKRFEKELEPHRHQQRRLATTTTTKRPERTRCETRRSALNAQADERR